MLCPNCDTSTLDGGKKISTCTNHVGAKITSDDLALLVPCLNCRRIDRRNFICLGPVHHYWNVESPCGEIQAVERFSVVMNYGAPRRFQSVLQPSFHCFVACPIQRHAFEQIQYKAVILGYMTYKETVMAYGCLPV